MEFDVVIVGAGPAGLACTGDLIKHGLDVTVFEALHVAGGVLKYGIPEFRLPDQIIDREVDALRQQGVQFELDTVVGKLFTIPQVLSEMGFRPRLAENIDVLDPPTEEQLEILRTKLDVDGRFSSSEKMVQRTENGKYELL